MMKRFIVLQCQKASLMKGACNHKRLLQVQERELLVSICCASACKDLLVATPIYNFGCCKSNLFIMTYTAISIKQDFFKMTFFSYMLAHVTEEYEFN